MDQTRVPASTYGLHVEIDTNALPQNSVSHIHDKYCLLAEFFYQHHGLIYRTGGLYYFPGVLTVTRVTAILKQAAELLPWLRTALRSVRIIQVQDVLT